MVEFMKKAFRPGKLMIASGFVAFLILISTQKVLAVTNNDFPYLLKVNRIHNTITVYAKDDYGNYNVPIKAIVCSVGQDKTQTVLGVYNTKEKYRWKVLMGNVYGQYSTRIVGGILFHSVYYYVNGNPASLATKEYNKLGSAASHGCIRLTVEDAKWIYDNCPVGTTVIIYDDKDSPGPLGKPEAMKLPAGVRWDPTDPSSKNPYKNKKPSLQGVKNHSIPWGSQIDLRGGVTAKSTVGLDITKNIIIKGSIDSYKSGTYNITYTVTDALGRTATKKSKVTVEESPSLPVIEGVRDRVVRSGTKITPEFVLSDITVTCNTIIMDRQRIEVTIDAAGSDQYLVTYRYWIGKKTFAEAKAKYVIDGEAPVFSGIEDRILNSTQIPDEAFALSGVSVTDNYTKMNKKDIKVTIEEIEYPMNPSERSEGDANNGLSSSTEIKSDQSAEDKTMDSNLDSNNRKETSGVNSEENLLTDGAQKTSKDMEQNENTNRSGVEGSEGSNNQDEKIPFNNNTIINKEVSIAYLVTYTAVDEAGNIAKATAIFKY